MHKPAYTHHIRTAVFSMQETTFIDLLEKCDFLDFVLASTCNLESEIKRRFSSIRIVNTSDIINNICPDFLDANIASDNVIKCYLRYENALLSVFSRRELSGNMTLAQMRVWIVKVLSLCYSLINSSKVELVFFHMIPHEPCEFAFYCAAKHLGIQLVMLNVTTAAYKAHFLCSDIDQFYLPNPPVNQLGVDYKRILSELIEDKVVKPHYEIVNHANVSFKPSFISLAFFLLTEYARLILRYPLHHFRILNGSYGDCNMPNGTIGFSKVTSYSKSLYRIRSTLETYRSFSYLINNESSNIDLTNVRYVYLPLHFQPEATTAPMGGIWENQYFLIKFIAESLPDGIKLFVKEHPSQFRFRLNSARPIIMNQMTRSVSFYESILQLPNTLLVSRWFDNTELLSHAEMICTITGTAGLEAFARGRKVAIFGAGCWYKQLEGIHFVNTSDDFRKALDAPALTLEQCREYLTKFLAIFDSNTFPVYQHKYSTEFCNYSVSDELVYFLKDYCFSTTSKLD